MFIVFPRPYSSRFHSATVPQPHTAASPLTSAVTLSRWSHHLTTPTGCSLKGCLLSFWLRPHAETLACVLPLYSFVLFQMFRPSESERHFEHMDNVRLYHQSLQEQAAHSVCGSTSGDTNPSTSFLFSALRYLPSSLLCTVLVKPELWLPLYIYRKKLGELDNIQRYFSCKLSTPTFPSMTDRDHHTRHEEQRKSETDTSQLLFKSNHLVGEVNNIISGEPMLDLMSLCYSLLMWPKVHGHTMYPSAISHNSKHPCSWPVVVICQLID